MAYLASRGDADPRGVGLFGVSRGGAAALCAAARDRRVQAVVTDGAFGTMAMQVHYMRRYMSIFTLYTQYFSRLPDWVLASLVRVAHRVVGYRRRIRFLSVESFARRVRQPVLMIHGEADPFVPLSVARHLQGQLHRATFWSVPGARHNAALSAAPDEYRRRVARFFLKHLAAGRRQAVAPAETEAVSS